MQWRFEHEQPEHPTTVHVHLIQDQLSRKRVVANTNQFYLNSDLIPLAELRYCREVWKANMLLCMYVHYTLLIYTCSTTAQLFVRGEAS